MPKNKNYSNAKTELMNKLSLGKKIKHACSIVKKDIYLCTLSFPWKAKKHWIIDQQEEFFTYTVDVAQLVRALDCGSRGRGFKSHLPPRKRITGFRRRPVFFFKRYLLAYKCKKEKR
jgi:hypothetical protein